jgi:hypothetical protein
MMLLPHWPSSVAAILLPQNVLAVEEWKSTRTKSDVTVVAHHQVNTRAKEFVMLCLVIEFTARRGLLPSFRLQ